MIWKGFKTGASYLDSTSTGTFLRLFGMLKDCFGCIVTRRLGSVVVIDRCWLDSWSCSNVRVFRIFWRDWRWFHFHFRCLCIVHQCWSPKRPSRLEPKRHLWVACRANSVLSVFIMWMILFWLQWVFELFLMPFQPRCSPFYSGPNQPASLNWIKSSSNLFRLTLNRQ